MQTTEIRRPSWSMSENLVSKAWNGSTGQQARIWGDLIKVTLKPNDSQPEKVERVQNSLENTAKLTADAIQCVKSTAGNDGNGIRRRKLTVRLTQETTMSALQTLHERYPNDKLAVLNNANDRIPGGHFLGGSTAQEESLCLYTNLLLTLKDSLYPIRSHELIYSPDVLVMKRDIGTWNGPLLDPSEEYWTDVISAAAVIGPPTKPDPNDITGYKKTWANESDRTTMQRGIGKIVEVAAMNHVQRLVLGAWGCGVFRNPVHAVAEHFRNVLVGGQAPDSLPPFDWAEFGLEEVVFAIYDRDKSNNFPVYNAFGTEFEKFDNLPEGMERVATEEVCLHLFWPVAPPLPPSVTTWTSIPGLLAATEFADQLELQS